MSIEKMEYVNVIGMMSDLDFALEKCVESGCFHIVSDNMGQSEMKAVEGENPYKDLLKRIIALDSSLAADFCEADDDDEVNSLLVQDIETDLAKMEMRFKSFKGELENLENAIAERKKVIEQLNHLSGMTNDLQKLFACNHIKPRFGRLPCESYKKLEYYEDRSFIFIPYDDDGSYKWGIYFAPLENISEIDSIFKALYFETIWLPDFISDTPGKEKKRLKKQVEQLEETLEKRSEAYDKFLDKNEEKVNNYFCRVKYLYDVYELRKYALEYKDKFYLSGYVPKKKFKKFEKLLKMVASVSVISNSAQNSEDRKVPVKLKMSRFTRPFSMFVEMYGLPSYGGFNPTTFVAITYTILFGIMFGDVGQGLLISLIGFIVYRKSKNQLGAIMERIGISSALFGLVYGSVFGYEHLLDPLYKKIGLDHKPIEVMDSTMTILLGAICIGIVIILLSIIINIYISFKKHDLTEAVFGNNGIAGLVFFAALLAGIAVMMTGGSSLFTLPYVLGLIVFPLVLMFLREPLGALFSGKKFHMESGIGDFIASNFFEVFEFILGYATNTLSFVRIGGFIFSHAGMMSVVMLLSESVSAGASPVVVVIGNLFVMGMEGLIVGIQVLRLEFYEVFSRFYDGDGIAFEPVKVSYEPNID